MTSAVLRGFCEKLHPRTSYGLLLLLEAGIIVLLDSLHEHYGL